MSQRIFLSLVFLAACSSTKPEATDDFSFLADQKSDAFSSKMKIAGNLDYGDAPLSVKYSKSPIYRAVTFTGTSGDPVEVWVRSTQGDALSWLLDSSYRVVTKNDDATSSTSDSHLTATLARTGTFYIVFRDYNYDSHYFTVELDGPVGGCALTLAAGGSNASIDGYEQSLKTDKAGWEIFTRKLPGCVDFSDAATQTRLRESLRTAGFLGGGNSVKASAVADGGNAFSQLLDQSLAALHAKSGADAHADSLEAAIKRPVLATPDAFLEVKLTLSGSCGETGDALVDTRTGIVYVIHQLSGC